MKEKLGKLTGELSKAEEEEDFDEAERLAEEIEKAETRIKEVEGSIGELGEVTLDETPEPKEE